MDTATQQEWLRLHLTQGLGRVGITKLIETFGDAKNALSQSRQCWKEQAGLNSIRIGNPPPTNDSKFINAWEQLSTRKAQIITLWDNNYPALLRTIHDPPALLYVCGKIPDNKCIAIVGSRKASRNGIRLAKEIATTLSQHHVSVISGLARGIDTAAHLGAIDGSGTTVAILGGGIDQIYPPENRKLFAQIAEQGAIISEYPPGTQPQAGHFPARNRIISGLCQGVLVVEAAHKSGSLITADFALEQGRDVYAAPGSVYNPNCQGNLQLLKQGAILTTDATDILEYCHIAAHPFHPPVATKYDLSTLTTTQKKLLDLLQGTPLHLDQLANESGLTAMEVSAIVLHLELEGLASALPGGRYIRGSAT